MTKRGKKESSQGATSRCRLGEWLTRHHWITTVARLVVGAVFLFSAAVKMIDPYGTVLKMDEYYVAMGLDWLSALGSVPALCLIVVEMVLGCALLLGVWSRVVATVTLVVNVCYLALTLWSAVWEPVADCGCFGDVIYLSAWATFGKNVVLTLLAWLYWKGPRGGAAGRGGVVATIVVGAASALFTIYSLVALPVVDRFPFGVGVNMIEAINEQIEADKDIVQVVCRHRESGEERVFAIEDPEWWDDQVWEFVSHTFDESRPVVRAHDFALYAGGYDLTPQVLMTPLCRLVCVERLDRLSVGEITKLRRVIQDCYNRDERVFLVTSSPLRDADTLFPGMEYANMDAVALRALLRAPVGVVTINRGIIVHKITLPLIK